MFQYVHFHKKEYLEPNIKLEKVPGTEFDCIAASDWQEHCLECAAPICFGNCINYSKRFDNSCRNLEYGIYPKRFNKEIWGIDEVRDESDKDSNIRIVVDLKSGADKQLVLNYLLKNTELQTNYNYNMVTIVNRRPKLLGIIPILDAYIAHQREVIKLRSEFDLATAKKEIHTLEGLVKALSILDEVIVCIRKSKNKTDARDNLVKEFEFTEEQAEAIVTLQLYRLTNTDVVALEQELAQLKKIIDGMLYSIPSILLPYSYCKFSTKIDTILAIAIKYFITISCFLRLSILVIS